MDDDAETETLGQLSVLQAAWAPTAVHLDLDARLDHSIRKLASAARENRIVTAPQESDSSWWESGYEGKGHTAVSVGAHHDATC